MDDIKTTSELIEKHGPKIIEEILCLYRYFFDKPKNTTPQKPINSFGNAYFGDLGNQSKLPDNLFDDVLKILNTTKITKPRKRREVFEEMRDECQARYKNSKKRLSFDVIARAHGVIKKEDISKMLSYQTTPSRLDVELICMILEAREDIQNEFLAACGESPFNPSPEKIVNPNNEIDLIVHCLKKWIIQEDIKIDGYNRTAMNLFNEAQREFRKLINE